MSLERCLNTTRRWARLTPPLVLALLVGCWALRTLGRDDLLLAVLAVELPAPVFGGLALLAVAGSVVARSWSAGIAALACPAIAVVPLGGWNVPSRAPQPARHMVLTCNVEQWSHDGAVVGRAFSQLAPDVFCLQEAVSYDDIPGDLNTAPNSVALSLLRQRLADAWRLRGHGFGFTLAASLATPGAL